MARLIQKSGYIKNGKVSGYMEYVATRDGVEIIQSTEPVTRKQERFIKRLLKDFPDAKELFEYSDYMQTPNRGTASAFIATVLAAMVCSARRTPPTSRRRRPIWKLTMGKCGRSFSPCGVRTRSAWVTTKPPRGRIC